MTSQAKLRMIINSQMKRFDDGELTDLAGALETVYDYLQFAYPLDFPGMENNYGLGAPMTDNIRVDHWYSGRTISIFYDRMDGARCLKQGTIETIVKSLESLWTGACADRPYWTDPDFVGYPFGHGWGMF